MASAATSSPAITIEFDRPTQIRTVVVGLAFTAVFYNVLLNLGYWWYHSADWSHGWLIPFFSAYLVYLHWDRVRRAPLRYTWVGLVLLLAALAVYQYSLWGLVIGYLRPFSMLICLLGVIIFLCGLPIVRQVWVPWLYLFFAVPIPKGYYFALTDPLRRMAAIVATNVLSLFPGLDIEKIGSTIHYAYGGQSGVLGVADACAGMRSTMTLCALGVAVTFISDRPWWQRLIMIASCVPIAVFSNFIRVTTTCVLHIFVDPKYATGTYHTVLGLVTLLIAVGIFSGLGWLLSNLFLEEPDEETAEEQGA
ncbi:MAG: exosortase/archaeosortase family protein [Phycisphaerae bacterium]